MNFSQKTINIMILAILVLVVLGIVAHVGLKHVPETDAAGNHVNTTRLFGFKIHSSAGTPEKTSLNTSNAAALAAAAKLKADAAAKLAQVVKK